jgi:hypothetical protein
MPRELKVFEASVPDPASQEMIPFAIRFNYAGGRDPVLHEFSAYANPGACGPLAMATVVRYDARGRQNLDLNGITSFFEAIMPEEEYARWYELLGNRELRPDMDLLGVVFNWLLEEIAGRPTPRSSPSSTGPPGTGASSMATLSSVGST